MAKLYWRIKRNGSWTWVAATPENTHYLGTPYPYYVGPDKLGSEYAFTAKEIGIGTEEE